jgi:hypothetical protein
MALKERHVDLFDKAPSVYIYFFRQRGKRDFTGKFEKFRDRDNKKSLSRRSLERI